tara:strand:- start:2005 stop:2886 length:882 start_codon:yes stop_codon:yes gene_type:complete
VVVRLSLGALSINGRRGGRKKDEFNPFAKDASQQHRRRRDERERQHARRPTAPTEPTEVQQQKPDIKADLERKQREAIEKLVQKGDVVAPEVAPAPVPVDAPRKKQDDEPAILSHEDRIAELRRKSEATKKNASRIESAPETVLSKPSTVEAEQGSTELAAAPPEATVDGVVNATTKSAKNVFATIETNIAPKKDRRRRRRFDKKGGGRQKPEKKLNRQKYLEYKYAAKDILDNPNVPEEHRSNVLGQVWAKGERQGIDECLAYIESKEEELILPEDVGNKLRDLIKRMTTKR